MRLAFAIFSCVVIGCTTQQHQQSDHDLRLSALKAAREGNVSEAESVAAKMRVRTSDVDDRIAKSKGCEGWFSRCESVASPSGARECVATSASSCEGIQGSYRSKYNSLVGLLKQNAILSPADCGDSLKWGYGKFSPPRIACDRCVVQTDAPDLRKLTGEFSDQESCESARRTEKGIVSDSCHRRFVGPDRLHEYWETSVKIGMNVERICFRSEESCVSAVASGMRYRAGFGDPAYDIGAYGSNSEPSFRSQCRPTQIVVCAKGRESVSLPCDLL